VSVLIGLAFVPAFLFCWLVKQRAYDDLCELEDRAYGRALQTGAWNVIRWVLVAILILITTIALPRIRQVIHWLRYPPVAATPAAPVAAVPPSGQTVPRAEGTGPSQRQLPRAETNGRAKSMAPSNSSGPGTQPAAPSSASGLGPRTSVLDSNDATSLMQAGLPQTGGIVQRVGNALAVIAGKSVTSGGTAGAVPTPQGFQWERAPNGAVRLRWMSVGGGYLYTVYGGFAGPQSVYDTCFHPPIRDTAYLWIPPKEGPKYYDLYVVAVDSKGNQSLPSQHQLIDLRNSQ
jgi:hypothetical protein